MSAINVSGQWVLVTGASGGIGKELALRFAAQGANLVVVARNREGLEQLQGEVETTCHCIVADLQTADGVAGLISSVEQLPLEVDHVVNNAGFGHAGAFLAQDPDACAGQLNLNCLALTQITRHFLPGMVERGHGGVLQVASIVGFLPTPYMAVYAATKAYVVSLSASLGEELKGTGVHCSALCPGPVPTSFQQRAGISLSAMERRAELPATQVAEVALRGYLRRRRVIVPGANNRLLTWATKHAPTSWSTSITAGVLRRAGRA